MVATRVYRAGQLAGQDFPISDVSEQLAVAGSTVWVDLGPDDTGQLGTLADELGLHRLAVRDALHAHPRPNFVRYPEHDFLAARSLHLDVDGDAVLASRPVSVFITKDAMVTVHDDDFDLTGVFDCWDMHCALSQHGAGFLLYGLLDYVVHSQYVVAQQLDEALTALEDTLFDGNPRDSDVQRRSHQLRRSLVELRRFAAPTREVMESLTDASEHLITPELGPYFRSVCDHSIRVTEWTDSLRDVVANLVATRVALHDSRMNVISKKVTGWAALAAVPALVTGFYGINVPFPGDGRLSGFIACIVIMAVAAGGLYWLFRRNDWL
jgi:magnesium transporter